MKKTSFLAAVLCLVLLFCLAQPVAADETDDRIGQILAYETEQAGVESVQALLDSSLTARAGIGAEWYVLALSRYDDTLDLSTYADALEQYLKATTVSSASSRQKYALALVACGRENTAFVRDTLQDSIGKQGIMSLVFGLHLLGNGLPSERYTVDALIDELLAYQLTDGGFAISGEHADADVTSMVLQALAPHARMPQVAQAIERALMCLSLMQNEDGSYQSYGVSNAESCAQVLMALCSLDVDPYTDTRFIKNDRTVVDALQGFACSYGGYSHELGGAAQSSATAQALCAYVALHRAQHGQGDFYSFENVRYDASLIVEDAPSDVTEPLSVRLYICLGIGALVLVACAVLLFLKCKRAWYDALLIFAVGAVLIVLVSTVRIQTPEDYYSDQMPVGEAVGTVTLSIRCDAVAGQDKHIPADGVILDASEQPLYEDDTVYDVLLRAAKQHRLLLETSGGSVGESSSRYIVRINGLGEFDFGELSGWVYTVDGVMPSRGCDAYRLKPDEDIIIEYTRTLGNSMNGEVES